MATERGAGTPPVEILERHFGAVAARTIARQLSHVFERSFSFATLVEPLRAAQFRGVDEKEGQPRRMETHYARALKSVRASVLFLTSWVRADNVNVRDITVERASVDELEAYDQSAAFVRRDGALAATWRAICAVAERLWGAMNDVAHVADMCAVCGLNDVIRENGIIQAPLFFRELARRSIAAVVEDVAKRTHSTLIVATNQVMATLLGQSLGGDRNFSRAARRPLAATPLFSRVVALDREDFIALGLPPELVVGFGVRVAISRETGVAHIFVATPAPHLWLEGQNEFSSAMNTLQMASFLCGRETGDVGALEFVADGWTRQIAGGLATVATHGEQIRNGGLARVATGGLAKSRLVHMQRARDQVRFPDLRATTVNDLHNLNRTLDGERTRSMATLVFELVHGLRAYGRGTTKFNRRRDRLPDGADPDEERAWNCFHEKHRSVNNEAQTNPYRGSQATKDAWDTARNALADIGNARRRHLAGRVSDC
jgi:hypothetical protein